MDPINSVQFSNHTGYSHIKGQVLSNKDLEEIFEGITLNGLHSKYTHLLTGYVGNDTFLRQIAKIIKELREVNPNLVYGKTTFKISCKKNFTNWPSEFNSLRELQKQIESIIKFKWSWTVQESFL